MTIGGMLLVTIPIFVAHLFGSEIRPGLVCYIIGDSLLDFIISSWLTPLMILDVGFDLLADGIRPLSDGRNPLAWILRHLPQSARQFECGAIARGIIFHLKNLILFSYLYFISFFFVLFYTVDAHHQFILLSAQHNRFSGSNFPQVIRKFHLNSEAQKQGKTKFSTQNPIRHKLVINMI